jgi:outer membrane protein assembly factor BamB
MKTFICLGLSLFLIISGPLQAVGGDDHASFAKRLIEESSTDRGVCVLLGAGDGQLALEIVKHSKFLTHVLDPDPAAVALARKTVDIDGLYGKRVMVEKMALGKLPYADNVIDLLVAADATAETLAQISPVEIRRVLRPGGKAFVGRAANSSAPPLEAATLEKWAQSLSKPSPAIIDGKCGLWLEIAKLPPEGVDDWSHWNHGPDNNPMSRDSVIKAPYLTQWMGEPYFIAMPSITTSAAGRLFTAIGKIAHHEQDEEWIDTLLARNAYNGTELWRRKLPDSAMTHRSGYIATDDVFYLIEGDRCLKLDPETGKEIGEICIPGLEGEWKWMAMKDGVLYALAGGAPDKAEVHRVKWQSPGWKWEQMSRGYTAEKVPWGFGRAIAAYDMEKGQRLWLHSSDNDIDSRAMAVGEEDLFFHEPGIQIGCLTLKTGDSKWTNTDAETIRLIDYRPEQPTKGVKPTEKQEAEKLISTPGFRSDCYALYTPEAIIYAAQQHLYVVGLSTRTGEFMWQRKKSTSSPNTLYADGRVLVGIGGKFGDTVALDPLTGETVENLGFQKRACARLTGCPDAFFVRALDGILRYSREEKKYTVNGAVRPACNDGVLPTNGMLHVGPWSCGCNLQLMGTVTMAPAGDFSFEVDSKDDARLEKGPAYGQTRPALNVSAEDWTTYRSDNYRSASSPVEVPQGPQELWTIQPSAEIRPAPPTAAGGLIFLAGDDCKVKAIDAATGKPAWTFTAGGAVGAAPTIWNGQAFFGAADGYIYALDAATGDLAWRFRAAPKERRIMVYGSLSSTWPVNTGVLVQDGVAYAAAGIIDYDGTYVYALDAMTGKVKWRNDTSGHLNSNTRKGVSAQGSMTIADGKLWMAGGHLFFGSVYDLATGQCLNAPPSDTARGETERGEEILNIDDTYILTGGKLKFSPLEKIVRAPRYIGRSTANAGNQPSPAYILEGATAPAWNDQTFLCTDGAGMPPTCYDIKTAKDFIETATGGVGGMRGPIGTLTGRINPNSTKAPHRWQLEAEDLSDVVSLALTGNAAIAVGAATGADGAKGWTVSALSLETGQKIWEKPLPGESFSGGLLVDRQGRVVVVMTDGRAVCYGD